VAATPEITSKNVAYSDPAHRQIVAMNDLIVRVMPEKAFDLIGSLAEDLGDLFRGVVRQAASNFLVLSVSHPHNIPFLKCPAYLGHANREKTLPLLTQRLDGPVIDDQFAAWLNRIPNPAFAWCDGFPLGQK